MAGESQNKAAELLRQLEQGVQQIMSSEGWARYLQTQARFRRYSMLNTLAIIIQRSTATRVAGIRTWNELGRRVKRGEKGIAILAPISVRASKHDAGAKEADEEPRVTRFRVVHVFDIEQTEGQPLPQTPAQRLGTSTEAGRELYSALLRIAHEDGFPVLPEAELRPGVNGEADLVARTIRLAPGLSEDHRARTLAHEIAHLWLHQIGGDRADQEAEAEGTAYVVASWAGLQCDGYSFGYLASWAHAKDGAAIVRRVGATIQKTAARMIDRLTPEEDARETA